MKNLSKRTKAFTLLEMTIALIVISIIIVGTLNASGLVKSSRLSVARSLTERSPVKNIDGLVAWYETTSFDSLAKAEASQGVTITNWFDINPESIPSKKNTLTQKMGTVTYDRDGINGVPALSFSSVDGTTENLELSEFAQGTTAQNTIFMVLQPRPRTYISSTVWWLIDSHSSQSVSAMGYLDNGTNGQVRMFSGAPAYSGGIERFLENSSYIYTIYYDGAYSKAYLNDATTVAGGGYLNNSPGSNALNGLTIGSLRNNRDYDRFVGLIAEIIIYNRVLKSQERKDVTTYLSKKYDITVSGL